MNRVELNIYIYIYIDIEDKYYVLFIIKNRLFL